MLEYHDVLCIGNDYGPAWKWKVAYYPLNKLIFPFIELMLGSRHKQDGALNLGIEPL
ncbi:hypothetical protein [Brevibacillus sp. SIMBA_076]|uniref:hypothetical protein n=1 Tax=Brevibacillus sp. SIMBA_076 TaxID=3085814 RepID=UPI00397E7A02